MPNNTTSNRSSNPIVCIQRSSYSKLYIDALLEPYGGMKHFVSPGERVLLKVNLLAASTPESAVVTHPAVVREVALAVQKAKGIPFIGDSPSGKFSKSRLDEVYLKSGLKALASELGLELNYDTRKKKIIVPNGKRLKKVPICNFVLSADKVIALPKLKTHSLMYMTLATKIMYGAIPGLTKAKYHSTNIRRQSFADMLLDILSVVPPHLNIMDGIVGMQGNGPFSGSPVDLNVLLASEDAIAMDIAVCRILGLEPMGLPTLRQANLRGQWPDKIQYKLLSPKAVYFKDFILPSSASYPLTNKKRPKRSPRPNQSCQNCGDCVEICPRHAMKIENEQAVVDHSRCIRCYCCHEVCSYKAIDLVVLK